jgi:tetratricopeptide (TPR) repeat protein
MVHRETGQYEAAERAYRQALAIRVQHRLRRDEADSLNELGNLYAAMVRREEAASFHRQAAGIYGELQDLAREGVARSNLANTLLQLGRYDEARREGQRAVECRRPFGHAAEPWKIWSILYKVEQAAGDQPAAARAREQAVEAYLAYRRDGGESQTPAAAWFAHPGSHPGGDTARAEQFLTQAGAEAGAPMVAGAGSQAAGHPARSRQPLAEIRR